MRTVRFERRKAGTDLERAKHEAMALVDLKPDVLVASSTVVTAALAERTRDIPIVFLAVADPIEAGFSDNLARPSRNMTGFALSDPAMGGKIVQLLKEVTPGLKRVTFIFDPDIGAGRQVLSVYVASTRRFASEMGLEFREAHVHGAREIEESMSVLGHGDSVWVGADSTIGANMKLIIELAARQKVPAIYAWPQYVKAGGLMSYSVEQADLWSDAADYVNRLLGGGVYAKTLADEFVKPGVESVMMFRNVQLKVKQAIGQDPWLSFPTLPAVYFAGTKPAALTPEQQVELAYWLSVKDSTSPEVLTTYLKRYPDGQFAEIARTLVEHYERKLKAEQAAQEEERKRVEEERKAAEVKRLEEERRAREAAIVEERKRAEESKSNEEAKHLEEQQRAELVARRVAQGPRGSTARTRSGQGGGGETSSCDESCGRGHKKGRASD